MRSLTILLGAALIGLMPSLALAADTPTPLSDAQRAQIEDVVRDFLIKKEPETIAKAVQALQGKESAQTAEDSKVALSKNQDKLFNDANAPVVGNLKGDITIVEFFDYQCGYCKMVNETLTKLLAEDKKIKVVYKEFPILGANSVAAAKISLAVSRTDKDQYEKFHNALMSQKDRLDEESIYALAKSQGLNVDKLRKEAANPAIDSILKANMNLAAAIGARGTPVFVIGEKIIPGALPLEGFKEEIATLRKAKK